MTCQVPEFVGDGDINRQMNYESPIRRAPRLRMSPAFQGDDVKVDSDDVNVDTDEVEYEVPTHSSI
jgi:hypothetical protein